MHELSVCQALLTQIAVIASQRRAEAVLKVTIQVGPLSGVEPTLLLNAFALMRLGGVASGAELLIEHTGVTICCLNCGEQTTTQANRLSCGACGGIRTRVVTGTELCLRRVEMRVPEPRLECTT